MLSKRMFALLSVIVALSLAILACGGGASPTEVPATRTPKATTEVQPTEKPAPTDKPEATDEPAEDTPEPEATDEGNGIVAGEVSVVNVYGYKDEYDYFHVTGLIFNDTENPVTNIELTLQLADGNGDTLLEDGDSNPVDETTFSPKLYTLAQGEASPFDYYISTQEEDTSEWTGNVSVTDFSEGDVDRGEVEVVNTSQSTDAYGTIYLTGEVVNKSDEPVSVNGLAGALLDADGNVIAADTSYNVSRYLAAAGDEAGNDRSPFTISLDGPADNADSQQFYADVDKTDTLDTGDGISLDIKNFYVDDYDSAHLAAIVGNSGDKVMAVSLVAGLYAEDGTVLDAAFVSAPIYVGPNEVVPVNFDNFYVIMGDTDLIDQVASYTVQVDRYWTYEGSYEVVPLETANESSESSGGYVTFTGDVNNISDQSLSSATVVLAIYDAEDNLYSSAYTSVYPDDSDFAAGETLPFEVSLYVPADLDTSNFSFVTYVQGLVQ